MQRQHNGSHRCYGENVVLPLISDKASLAEPNNENNYEIPGAASQHYLERQKNRESNARSYPRRICMAIKEAKGIYITDADGNNYFDCLAGAGTLALGHNHPVVLDAIRDSLDANLPLHTLDLTTPVKDAFVEELFASLPAEFAQNAKIQFCGHRERMLWKRR